LYFGDFRVYESGGGVQAVMDGWIAAARSAMLQAESFAYINQLSSECD